MRVWLTASNLQVFIYPDVPLIKLTMNDAALNLLNIKIYRF